MRLICGKGDDVRLAGGRSQNTVRIARTVYNVSICRTFLRWVFLQEFAAPPSPCRVRPAWLRWGVKPFSALVSTCTYGSQTIRTLPMKVRLGVVLGQQGPEV